VSRRSLHTHFGNDGHRVQIALLGRRTVRWSLALTYIGSLTSPL